MASKQKQILLSLQDSFQPLLDSGDIKLVNRDRISLDFSDFDDMELPAIQLIAGSTVVVGQERNYVRRVFTVGVTLVMRQESNTQVVDQETFFDLADLVEKAAIAGFPYRPALNVVNVIPRSVEPDLHLIGPHYIAIINLEITYQDQLRDC